jgi:hypothetical protein
MTADNRTATSLKRRTVLAAAIAVIGLAGAANAFADSDPVDIKVVDRESGQLLKVWRHDGRLFVAGAPGDRYGLRVTNRTDRRVLVVMSVDGVNILSGETAGYGQRGYIFDPHTSYDLNGWRKSLSEVADFTFTRLPQSYAALTGRPANVGVIGIAVFDEKVAPVAAAAPADSYRGAADGARSYARSQIPAPRQAMRQTPEPPRKSGDADDRSEVTEMVVTGAKRESTRQSAPAAITAFTSQRREAVAAEPRDEHRDDKLGTGHGQRELSEMVIEPFERATSYPQFTQEIAYDTRDNLVAMGVIPSWRYGERRPQPFPSNPGGAGFVPDPPDDY